jgi:hypothetical protein
MSISTRLKGFLDKNQIPYSRYTQQDPRFLKADTVHAWR